MKMSIPELTISDFSLINDKQKKFNDITERNIEKDVSFDNNKDKKEYVKIKIQSKKDNNTNQTEKNDDYKPFSTLKDIFRLKQK